MSASTPSWSDLLLGTEPRLRDRALLSLLGSLVYLVWFLVLVTFAIPQQRVSPELGLGSSCLLMVPGMLLFYPLVRSGWTAALQPIPR
jgi:hypothetical protein